MGNHLKKSINSKSSQKNPDNAPVHSSASSSQQSQVPQIQPQSSHSAQPLPSRSPASLHISPEQIFLAQLALDQPFGSTANNHKIGPAQPPAPSPSTQLLPPHPSSSLPLPSSTLPLPSSAPSALPQPGLSQRPSDLSQPRSGRLQSPSGLQSPSDLSQPPSAVPQPPSGLPSPPSGLPSPPSGLPSPPSGLPSPPSGLPQSPSRLPQPPSGFPQPPSGFPQPPSGLPQPPSGLPQPPSGLPQPPSGLPQPPSGLPQPPSGLPQPLSDLPQPPPQQASGVSQPSSSPGPHQPPQYPPLGVPDKLSTDLSSPPPLYSASSNPDVPPPRARAPRETPPMASLDPFHFKILAWDAKELNESIKTKLYADLESMPNQFASVPQYQDILFPLLLEEFRANVTSCLDEKELIGLDWLVELGVDASQRRTVPAPPDLFELTTFELSFHSNAYWNFKVKRKTPNLSQAPPCLSNDLVLLWPRVRGSTTWVNEWQEADTSIFGLVKQVDKTKTFYQIVVYMPKNRRRIFSRWLLDGELEWGCMPVMNITTANREYRALQHLDYLELQRRVIGSQLNDPSAPASSIVDLSQHELNPSQQFAVTTATNDHATGFTLIQGPPGTGKTKTILAIVNVAIVKARLRGDPFRVLVCAPSNAAIDEVLERLTAQPSKLLDHGGGPLFPGEPEYPVIRVGAMKRETDENGKNKMLKELSKNGSTFLLDDLVEKRLRTIKDTNDELSDTHRSTLSSSYEAVTLEIADRKVLCQAAAANEQQEEQVVLELEIQQLSDLATELQSELNAIDKQLLQLKDQFTREILEQAVVVCATLSSSGKYCFRQSDLQYDLVIVDEACQAVELAALIPLQYGCAHCVLVGDPQQLSATVFSDKSTELLYKRSLFQRLLCLGYQVTMLDTQYRMHPEISRFPASYFYNRQLRDHQDLETREGIFRSPQTDKRLSPYVVYNLKGSMEERAVRSLTNPLEVNFIVHLILYLQRHVVDSTLLRKDGAKELFGDRVGVITPYSQQAKKIRDALKRVIVNGSVEVATVDSFQGKEKDIIIFSCVRANSNKVIGFVKEACRLNVALTRAKHALFLVGSLKTLRGRSTMWSSLVKDARKRQKIIPVPNNFSRFFTDPCHLDDSDDYSDDDSYNQHFPPLASNSNTNSNRLSYLQAFAAQAARLPPKPLPVNTNRTTHQLPPTPSNLQPAQPFRPAQSNAQLRRVQPKSQLRPDQSKSQLPPAQLNSPFRPGQPNSRFRTARSQTSGSSNSKERKLRQLPESARPVNQQLSQPSLQSAPQMDSRAVNGHAPQNQRPRPQIVRQHPSKPQPDSQPNLPMRPPDQLNALEPTNNPSGTKKKMWKKKQER